MKPKVLVGSLTSRAKDYCFQDWIGNVKSFTYPDFELFISDNSFDLNYSNFLKGFAKVGHIDPAGKTTIEVLCESHNQVRDYFLSTNADFLLHLESDVFPPSGIIEELLFHSVDVVSGMYFYGEGSRSKLLINVVEDFGNVRNANKIDHRISDIMFADGGLKRVFSCGIGCTLIHRSVLEKVSFRYEKTKLMHPDAFFYHDIFKAGITAWLDTSILCEHRNTNWNHNIIFDNDRRRNQTGIL
ncbi:hypothetical protein MYP_666 [Sporocytophaga myxococcoides]|uniref:Glycosyltransferase n=2 Tax=Sporocytophaga myxococcoides TaxID=153721 RepID=A0A098LAH5_9BACT|nr:hypothetical protein MYP_666 [Sporocytophaga myxococcoides]